MSHRTTRFYRILERPAVYKRFQALLGGPAAMERFVKEFLRPLDEIRLLDVGCGTGSLLDHLPPTTSYVGYDVNPAYIAAARRRYGNRGQFFCARVGHEPLEIEQGSFRLVVAVALLHHLSDDDAGHLVQTAQRLLSPGGSFVSIDPALHEGQHWFSRLLARLDRGSQVRSPEAYRRLLAPHFPSVEDWLLTDMLAVPYSHCILRATKEM